MSQDLAQEARAVAHVENTRKSAVIAGDREVGHRRHLRLREEAEIVLLAVAQDRRGERRDFLGAEVVHPVLIDSADQ